jgi:hypothetical protein
MRTRRDEEEGRGGGEEEGGGRWLADELYIVLLSDRNFRRIFLCQNEVGANAKDLAISFEIAGSFCVKTNSVRTPKISRFRSKSPDLALQILQSEISRFRTKWPDLPMFYAGSPELALQFLQSEFSRTGVKPPKISRFRSKSPDLPLQKLQTDFSRNSQYFAGSFSLLLLAFDQAFGRWES